MVGAADGPAHPPLPRPVALRRSALRVDVDVARQLLAEGAVLIDVRRHDDETMPLEDAVRIPPDEIAGRLAELSRHTPLVLACT